MSFVSPTPIIPKKSTLSKLEYRIQHYIYGYEKLLSVVHHFLIILKLTILNKSLLQFKSAQPVFIYE